MKVRIATFDDIEGICDLSNEVNIMHCESMPNDFKLPDTRLRDASHWKVYFDDPDSIVYVAEVDGEIVGTICAKCILNTVVPFIKHRKKCHIGTIVVSSERVRDGIGRALMQKIEVFARESECEAVHLEVMEFNSGAQDFYRALGYGDFSRKMAKDI